MSRKHNCKHPERGISNYPKRKARRVSETTMEGLRDLRKKQLRRTFAGEGLEAAVNEGLGSTHNG
jgi:hypothetical protein